MKGVAVVTGGGRGIGRAAAEALSADGWNVVVAGRTQSSLDETVAGLEGEGLGVVTDVSSAEDVDNLVAQAVAKFGRIDLLFNNAGIAAPAAPIDEIDIETWERVISVNVTGAFLCARAVFGQMRKQSPSGGRIINNGSVSAETPRLFSTPYTCSKHAVSGLTKCLSLDGRKFGITAGQINLGNVSSDMGDEMAQGMLQPDGSTKPEPTMGVNHVADALLYIANLPVDTNVLSMTLMANGMPFVGRG